MQLYLEELSSTMFMFFFGALGYFFMRWMKFGTTLKTQRTLLQKKLESIPSDSEAEQTQTKLAPLKPQVEDFLAKKVAKNNRKRQQARVRAVAESVQNTKTEPADTVETPSVSGCDIKLESQPDAGSRELAGVDAEPLLSSSDPADAVETSSVTGFDVKPESEPDAGRELAGVDVESLLSSSDPADAVETPSVTGFDVKPVSEPDAGRELAGVDVKSLLSSSDPADAVQTPSVTGFDIKPESGPDTSSRELVCVDAETLLFSSDQQKTWDHLEYNDSVGTVEVPNDASSMENSIACEMGGMNTRKQTPDNVDIGGHNSCSDQASMSIQKTVASHQEGKGCMQFEQQPVECCQGPEDSWALGDEERRQLLGEWPETETEDSCSDHDIDGTWDDSSDDKVNQVPFKEHLNGWSTSGNLSSVESGRRCKSAGQDGSANAPGWFSDEKWYGRMRQPHPNGMDVPDEWMVPFDELTKRWSYVAMPHAHEVPFAPQVQQPWPLPAAGPLLGGSVCIWNAGPDGCGHPGGSVGNDQDSGSEIFTDGQQVFQPVPSATGESLFTDGKQLYASVCVMFSPPSPAVALTPESPTHPFGFVPDSNDEDGECL